MALVAMFAAVGLITATGAFTTVEAERTATVDVTGDAEALLGLSAADDLENEDIVTGADDGEISLDFSSNTLDAQGLNPNADTTFDPVLTVANNGADDVSLTINLDISGDLEGFYFVDGDGNEINDGDSIDLDSGSTADLGVVIQTGDTTGEDFEVDITFTAQADN